MKVSIVVPTYNEEKYLAATLDSIRHLNRQPDEILIIDSNSTDKTQDIAKQYHTRCLNIQKRGIGFARQMGVEQATGDIIAFTDADTTVPPDWLDKIISTLKKPGVAGVYSGFHVPDGWLPYRLHINLLQPLLLLFHHAIGIPMAPGQNTAFWKHLAIKAGGYPTDFKIGEDIEMARRLLKVGRVIYLRDLYVTSSGRRGNEGWPMLWRATKFYFSYLLFHTVKGHTFPDFR